MPSHKYTDLPSSPEQFTVTPAAAQKLLEFRPDDLAMFPVRISAHRKGPFLEYEMSYATESNTESDVLVQTDNPGVIMDRLTAARMRNGSLEWNSVRAKFQFETQDWPSSDMTGEPWQKDFTPEQAPVAYELLAREVNPTKSPPPDSHGELSKSDRIGIRVVQLIGLALMVFLIICVIGAFMQENQ